MNNDEIMMEEESMEGGDHGSYLYTEDGTIDAQQLACPNDCGCWAIRYTGAILYADAVTICPDCGDVTQMMDDTLENRRKRQEEE